MNAADVDAHNELRHPLSMKITIYYWGPEIRTRTDVHVTWLSYSADRDIRNEHMQPSHEVQERSVKPVVAPLENDEATSVAREAGIADVFVKMNLFRTSLRQPGVAQLWATVVQKLVVAGTLDARIRELVILRVAWVTDGMYEWSNHYPYAIGIGMNDAEIIALRHWQNENPALTGDDRLVLQTVDSILVGRAPSADQLAELNAIVGGNGPLMELLILPGIYHSLSMLTGTLGIALDEGKRAWLPDGVAPTAVHSHEDAGSGS